MVDHPSSSARSGASPTSAELPAADQDVPAAAAVPTARGDRHGALQPGDLVQLTDPKGRHHTFALVPGRVFHTHKGWISHDDLLGQPEGIVVTTNAAVPYLVLRPLLRDFVLSMPRGATVVYPKDAAAIVGLADVFPGASVIEAGAGSGALTCTLLRAVGATGRLHSFERRADFAEIARTNVERFLGGPQQNWRLSVGGLEDADIVEPEPEPERGPEAGAEAAGTAPAEAGPAAPERHHPLRARTPVAAGTVHRVILDMLAPWDCIGTVARALMPGGILVVYVATTTQLSRMAESLRVDGRFTEPEASELLLRGWHLEGLAVRPQHRMNGHTGFLLGTRRLAPGTVLPRKRSRPAKCAYGTDYDGPGAPARSDSERGRA
jgi:tRNA (adenine57-N1/adenine58-N1)-methyltransferase catalytic subunit